MAVEVIVKRRRLASRDGQAVIPRNPDPRGTRTSRTFRLGNPGVDGHIEVSRADVPMGDAYPIQESGSIVAPPVGKRRRRVRNGRVTIIRPRLDMEGAPVEAVEAPAAPSAAHDRRSELGPFRMRDAAERRYDRLMQAIARLERQAAAVRTAEIARAVRGIQRTMARYGIQPCEVGA